LGFGPSAHGYDGIKRWNNFSNLDKYISLLKNGESPIETFDYITEIKRINEIIGFGLRIVNGFDLLKIPVDLRKLFDKQLQQTQLKFPAMIIEENNRLRLTQEGMNFADAIAVELMI
jgi:oxygen-independent coproporphyrinogen-3 oxidase